MGNASAHQVVVEFLTKLNAVVCGEINRDSPSCPNTFEEVDHHLSGDIAGQANLRSFAVFVNQDNCIMLMMRCCTKIATNVQLETVPWTRQCVRDLLQWLLRAN